VRAELHSVLVPHILNTTDCVLERFCRQRTFRATAVVLREEMSAKEAAMLRWAIAFFIIAIVAAIFGFGGIAVAAAGIAKILFFIFLVLFLVALLSGLVRRA
jgi:uncharacterized membrane protein YtjA (UPF0391 family)